MTTAISPSHSTATIRATESWDNDDDLLFDDNESIGDLKDSQSSNTQSATRRRTSNIRTFSGLRTLEENDKEDITQQFELSTDDIEGAFNLALKAGIPIPKDTPSSALIGGTINRLGTSSRKGRPVNNDDWSEDIDIPDTTSLKLSIRRNMARTPSPLPAEFAPRLSGSLNPSQIESGKDDFEGDFELPADIGTFELKSPTVRKEVTTPLPTDDFDDWAEGSLGTRYAGTRRVGVLSDFSPSASSAITVESDADDPMDGLEFSTAHVNLQEVLERRMKERAQEMSPTKPRLRKVSAEDDLLGGLDLGDEENPFRPSKLKANQNILHRLQTATPSSPQRKVAVSVTFADKPSKIPRPSFTPVPTPPLLSPAVLQQSTRPYTHRPASARLSDQFNEKSLQKKPSVANFSQFHSTQADSIRNRALGAKISMPALRAAAQSPPKPRMQPPPVPPIPDRAKSRAGRTAEGATRAVSRTESPRPRSPEVTRNDGASMRPAFIPGGASVATSHHVAALKAPLRQNSISTLRSASSSGKRTPMFAPENLRREALRQKVLTVPRRIRDFGDGSELDAFDDLPVSHAAEKKYRVQAKGVGTPNGVHRFTTPNATVKKLSDENRKEPVSRIDWRSPAPPRNQQGTLNKPPRKLAPSSKQNTIKGRPKPPGKGPTLIKNLNSSLESKGKMTYNPRTHRWDGNEDILREFDSITPRDVFTPPRPALISNITSGSIRGVQVVGGMIFDPQRMCWLTNTNGENLDGFDEDDPFEGLEDLKDDDTSHMTSDAGVLETDDTVMLGSASGNDFEVDVAWKEKQVEWETRWKATMRGWNSGASIDRGEERRRTELFDIWHLANSSKR